MKKKKHEKATTISMASRYILQPRLESLGCVQLRVVQFMRTKS